VIPHLQANGRGDVARLHDHVYVGAEGIADQDGQHWPVDVRKHIVSLVEVAYASTLRDAITENLGAQWTRPDFSAPAQILGIDPALMAEFPRVVCSDAPRVLRRWIVQEEVYPSVRAAARS
jgi:hypothetical protein